MPSRARSDMKKWCNCCVDVLCFREDVFPHYVCIYDDIVRPACAYIYIYMYLHIHLRRYIVAHVFYYLHITSKHTVPAHKRASL